MHTILSTGDEPPSTRFSRWREAIHDRIVPVELERPSEEPFRGTLEAVDVGGLAISRVTQSAMRTEATWRTVRRHRKHETLSVVICLDGTIDSLQDDRTATQRPGDIVVLERRPVVMDTRSDTRSLILEVPRESFSAVLGSPRLYSALTIGGERASTRLATTYLSEMVRLHDDLSPQAATRAASIGVELLVASIADRLASEVQYSLQSTVVLQRAKAYVEANLSDPALDVPRLAAAVGVSVRRLQALFQEQQQYASDWIWQRRLEVAAARLGDPRHRYVSIGSLAHACGFSSQSHFTRRFKHRYGETPTDYQRRITKSTSSEKAGN